MRGMKSNSRKKGNWHGGDINMRWKCIWQTWQLDAVVGYCYMTDVSPMICRTSLMHSLRWTLTSRACPSKGRIFSGVMARRPSELCGVTECVFRCDHANWHSEKVAFYGMYQNRRGLKTGVHLLDLQRMIWSVADECTIHCLHEREHIVVSRIRIEAHIPLISRQQVSMFVDDGSSIMYKSRMGW